MDDERLATYFANVARLAARHGLAPHLTRLVPGHRGLWHLEEYGGETVRLDLPTRAPNVWRERVEFEVLERAVGEALAKTEVGG